MFAEYTQKTHKLIPSMSSKLVFNAAEARLLDPSREEDKTLLQEACILNLNEQERGSDYFSHALHLAFSPCFCKCIS